jgi:pilus assembly protein CpaF
VVHISEVLGMEGDTIVMQDIFKFEDRGEQEGRVLGDFVPAGLRPAYDARLRTHGFNLPPAMFMKAPDAGRRR